MNACVRGNQNCGEGAADRIQGKGRRFLIHFLHWIWHHVTLPWSQKDHQGSFDSVQDIEETKVTQLKTQKQASRTAPENDKNSGVIGFRVSRNILRGLMEMCVSDWAEVVMLGTD